MENSINGYNENCFIRYLSHIFGWDIANKLGKQYWVGSSNHWPGATLFWFVDKDNRVRAGQVKLFNEKGHTVKYHTTWVHSILKDSSVDESWLAPYLNNKSFIACLFGEHLLNQHPYKPVALVEAPATAITASVYIQDFIWLATGSLGNLTKERCQSLRGRKVVLFPDLGGYRKWIKRSKEMDNIAKFTTSNLLEIIATDDEREAGLDLRDYLTRYNISEFLPQGNLHTQSQTVLPNKNPLLDLPSIVGEKCEKGES